MTYTSLQSSHPSTCSKKSLNSCSASVKFSGQPGGVFRPQGTDSRYRFHRRSPSRQANGSSTFSVFGLFGSEPISIFESLRRFSVVGTEAISSFLLLDKGILPAKKNFRRSVSPDLSAERAADHSVVAGKGLDASRNVSPTEFTAYNPLRRERPLKLGVVHAHGGIVGEVKANSFGVVVDGKSYPRDCDGALEMVQEVFL